MGFVLLLGLGMGSHGGPWEPDKHYPGFLVPALQRGNAYRCFRAGMGFVLVLGLGMGSHGGPWEPDKHYPGFLVPALQRGNAYRCFRAGMGFVLVLGLGMGSHGGPWEPDILLRLLISRRIKQGLNDFFARMTVAVRIVCFGHALVDIAVQ